MAARVLIDAGKLKRARLRKGWTLRDLAGRCEELGATVDFGSIGRWERGDNGPNPGVVPVLAAALDLDVDDFLLPASGSAA